MTTPSPAPKPRVPAHSTPEPSASARPDAPGTAPERDLTAGIPAYRARLATNPTGRPRARSDNDHPAHPPGARATRAAPGQHLLRLAQRITDRDRWLLTMLLEHRVLTTWQITQLAFTAHRRALRRLATLYDLALLDRFRPYTAHGSAPMHYLLSPTGADVLAATLDTTTAALGYHPERLNRLAVSLHLAHDVGANTVFTSLAAHARITPDTHLTLWWSPRRCLTTWQALIRPDGYGRWRTPATDSADTGAVVEVDFFLEYDTGTENLDRLTAKLDGYAHLAATSGLPTLILFWLPGRVRETHLHQAITTWRSTRPGRPALPIATAVPTLAPGSTSRPAAYLPSTASPADVVWLPATTTNSLHGSPGDPLGGRRVTLAALADLQTSHRGHTPSPATAPAGSQPTQPTPAQDHDDPPTPPRSAPDPAPPQAPRPAGTHPAATPGSGHAAGG